MEEKKKQKEAGDECQQQKNTENNGFSKGEEGAIEAEAGVPEQNGADDQELPCGKETLEKEGVERQLEEYRQKSQEYFDRLLRLQADFDNYRKRIAREKEQMYQDAACEVLSHFLGIIDNMERAFGSIDIEASNCEKCRSTREGIQMILRQVDNILSRFGVEEIPAEGEMFNPNYHYAVMQVETPDAEDGTVVEVLQKGYKTQHKVLRPSMVKVAKKVKEEDAHE